MSSIIHASAIPKPLPDVYPFPVPSGCVLYYDMQEQGSVIIDHSGRGNHGTNSNSTSVAGTNGLVRLFDGIDDSIDVANTYTRLNGELTIEAWIKPGTVTIAGTDSIFYHGKDTGALIDILFGINTTAGGNISMFWSNNYVAVKAGGLSIAAWWHIVGVRSGIIGAWIAEVFANGISKGSSATAINPPTVMVDAVSIVAGFLSDILMYPGKIGLLRVYNRALSAVEVKTLYQENAWRYGVAA